MKLHANCPCGAMFDVESERGYYINAGGHPDEKGRIFQIEVILDRWLVDHKDHGVTASGRVQT